MSKYLVRTAQDLYTIEALTYTIDSQGLKLTGEGGAVVASFPSYESMVNVSALVSNNTAGPVTESGSDETEAPAE